MPDDSMSGSTTISAESVAREMKTLRDAAREQGWQAAVAWLRRHSDAHAGKWAGMEPREALRNAAMQMEVLGYEQ